MEFVNLDRYIDSIIEKYAPPAFDVSAKVGDKYYRRRVGYSDAEKTKPVSGGELYILYSATKVITGAALSILIDNGTVSLDDRVSKYLPEFSEMKVLCQADGGEKYLKNSVCEMKIRHLATMTAGLTYNRDTQYIRDILREKSGHASTRDIVKAISKEPLIFDPGEGYNYSLCLDVAGAVIEEAAGMSFGNFLSKHIFEPLCMYDTTFFPNAEQKSRLIVQYEKTGLREYKLRGGKNEFALSDRFEGGGAGLFSTAEDYMKFASALSGFGEGENGVRFMKKSAVEIMRTPLLTPTQLKAFSRMGKFGCSYGIGVRTMCEPWNFGLATPVGEFGWDSMGAAYVSVYPEAGCALVFMADICEFDEAYISVHHKLREAFYKDAGFTEQHRKDQTE